MNVKVVRAFADKNDFTITYAVGAVLDFDEERAADCVSRGLVEIVEKPAAKAKTTKKTQAKK